MSVISDVLRNQEATILSEWIREMAAATRRADLMSDNDLRLQATELLRQITAATQNGGTDRIDGPEWKPVRELLTDISASRAAQGFSPSETATFVFSLKRSLIEALRKEIKDPAALFQ